MFRLIVEQIHISARTQSPDPLLAILNGCIMNFDKTKYKVYTWKNWMMLHWILNPGLIINELVLGQRVPKITLEDKTTNKPRFERGIVPCPHCETLHDSRTWSTENGTAFKNWFGLYCNNCGNVIPCLINVFSLLVLITTYPIWGWFKKDLKKIWLEKQPQRFKNIDIEKVSNPFDQKSWIKTGLSWGVSMFIMMSIIFPLCDGSEINTKTIIMGIVLWTISGFIFGFTMKLFFNTTLKKQS